MPSNPGDGPRHDVPDTTLADLFAAQVARTPESTAVIVDGPAESPSEPPSELPSEWAARRHELTYAELDARVDRLARMLVAYGAGPERVVAVALPRSVDLVVALLAAHRAGAAYLPLDPDYPAERIGFMLADAAPAVVLTCGSVASDLPPGDAPVLVLDAPNPPQADGREDDQEGVRQLLTPPRPDHPAYVIYTSGSTGRPKGVVVTHRAIVNRLLWMQAEYDLQPGDRVVQKTPSSFDVSVWEFFWPLIVGAALVVAKPGGHQDPGYLAGLIATERVTTAHFVPSMLRAFLTAPDVATHCSSLRRVLCSGEALPAELASSFHATIGTSSGTALHNLYGPTEAAVDVTSWACAPTDRGPVPIGRPVWNTGLRVLDDALRPVAIGETGELYLSGVQLARGYLARPGLTAERFVPDPAGPPGSRMYRTGDLARWRTDGALDYLGRVDHQVKLRGFRIELGEVEAALARCPGVVHAAVLVHDERLVGYYAGAAEPGPDPDELRTSAWFGPARVHGPGGLRPAGRHAAHGQRQAGPFRSAGAGLRHVGWRRAAGYAAGGAGVPVVRGDAGRSSRRRTRQLLRTRRRQHPGDAPGVSAADGGTHRYAARRLHPSHAGAVGRSTGGRARRAGGGRRADAEQPVGAGQGVGWP